MTDHLGNTENSNDETSSVNRSMLMAMLLSMEISTSTGQISTTQNHHPRGSPRGTRSSRRLSIQSSTVAAEPSYWTLFYERPRWTQQGCLSPSHSSKWRLLLLLKEKITTKKYKARQGNGQHRPKLMSVLAFKAESVLWLAKFPVRSTFQYLQSWYK